MSLLLSEGHWQAREYPIGKVQIEAALVKRRRAKNLRDLTSLMATAAGASQHEDNTKILEERLRTLSEQAGE